MGKATVVSGGAEGRYTINVDLGNARKTQELAAVNARIAELEPQIAAAYLESSNLDSQINSASNAVEAAITAYSNALTSGNGDLAALQKAIQDALSVVNELVKKKAPIAYKAEMLKAEQNNLISRRAVLQGLQLTDQRLAWCADFTENATGEVATIEVPDEPVRIYVAPGGIAPTAQDGVLVAREMQTPEQVFVNAAILPGVQKWKPKFRIGTLASKDDEAGTCVVLLDEAKSTPLELDINFRSLLQGVPIEYMDCNGAVFEPGDKVLVRFEGRDWFQPKVIGFADGPRPCAAGLSFNGGVYRDWWHSRNFPDIRNIAYTEIYLYLTMPLKEMKKIYDAENFVGTISNQNWGTVNLNLIKDEDYLEATITTGLQQNSYTHYQTKTVLDAFGNPNQVTEELRVSIEYFFKDESSQDYQDWLVQPCNQIIIEIAITENLWGEQIMGMSKEYWINRLTANIDWQLYLEFDSEVLVDGTLTTTWQPDFQNVEYTLGDGYPHFTPIYGEPTLGWPLSDAFVCKYEGERIPQTKWKWSGTGIAVPAGLQTIEQI